MIIIQLSGGLGNQMFQYALYLQLKAQGRKVKIDDRTEYQGSNSRNIQLPFFHTEYEIASRHEIDLMTDSFMDPFHRIKRKVFGRKRVAYHEKGNSYNSEVFQFNTMYMEGCWQSEKYFKDSREVLCSTLTLRDEYRTEKERAYLSRINMVQSVGIHIRRGDYLASEVQDLYGNICTEEYYRKAICEVKKNMPEAEFFVFTNDIDWARANISDKNFTIVNCSTEETGYLDMDLMSHCKHNIIANSSFSWWASYLNPNPDKMVIAPKIWLNGRDCSDIYRSGMLVI